VDVGGGREEPRRGLAGLAGLLGELNDLKRVRRAGEPLSVAGTLFARAWAALVAADADPREVALAAAADAVAAARLGGIDRGVLGRCGLDERAALAVLRRSYDAVAEPLAPPLRAELCARLGRLPAAVGPPPVFVAALADQARAGPTCPGKPRIVLEPPESHAEHCGTVAVYAVLLSPLHRAAPEDGFLLGMAHHFHNVVLPDAGFAGEELLGGKLEPIVERLTAEVMANLPRALAERIARLWPLLADAAAPAARAFHAADVIDRVLQVRQHARAAAFTVDQALGELELVHSGPVQAFHLAVLEEAELP
jgi:5'-deoxynucleotidase YfbR-like HD superfamily hydrolase